MQQEIKLGSYKSVININLENTLSEKLKTIANGNDCDKSLFLIEQAVFSLVKDALPHNNYIVCPGGENAKTQAVFENILQSFFDNNLSRKSSVIVIGGGALCDVGSFAASMYMRGINLVLFPTTLLSMVDAAIGGKTAINYGMLKNMVGSFYPATQVCIYPHFLLSLPKLHLHSGLSEVLKAGMLHSENIIVQFEQQSNDLQQVYNTKNHKLWQNIIWDAAKVKMHFVESDFTEQATSGIARAFLNLGHSFAHAIETEAKIQNQKWEHGQAVALGIRSALLLGEKLQITNTRYAQRIINILNNFAYPSYYPQNFKPQNIFAHMTKDKKNTATEIRLVLQKNISNTILHAVHKKDILNVLEELTAH